MGSTHTNQFLESFHDTKRPFGWYLFGSLIIILFSFLGQLPLLFFISETNAVDSPSGLFSQLDSNLLFFLLLIPSLVGFFGFLWVIRQFHHQTIVSVTTARSSIDMQRVAFGFCFWGGLSVLIFMANLLLFPDNYQLNFKWKPFLIMLVIACTLIPTQSALEEWLFRGYLMQGFATLTKSRWMALVLTSVIFGSLHILNPEVEKLGYGLMAYYIGTGLFFGIISLMDEGIELAIGFHVANNLITAILVTANWTAFQTESIYKDISEPQLLSEMVLFLAILYPISLFVLAKKYNWSNWKSKLTASLHE